MSTDTAVCIFMHPFLEYSYLALVLLRTMSPIPVGTYVLRGLCPRSRWCIRSQGKMFPIHDGTSVMYVLSGHYDLFCCTTDTPCQSKQRGDNLMCMESMFLLLCRTMQGRLNLQLKRQVDSCVPVLVLI